MFPVMVSADHSTAGDIDCHSAASLGCAEGPDHYSTNWVVPGTYAGSLADG